MTNITKKHDESVLVLEDNFIIAMEAENAVVDCGKQPVTVNSLEDADKYVGKANLGGAIIDYNIGSKNSFKLVQKLVNLGVPCTVVSGADTKQLSSLRELMQAGLRVYRKPVDYRLVVHNLLFSQS